MNRLDRKVLRAVTAPANIKELDFIGDTSDIIKTVLFADKYSQEDTAEAADLLRGKNDYESAKNVWGFVVRNLRYVADKKGHEKVRGPAYTFNKGTGDCKNFSIAVSSFLKNLGIKHRFRFVGYELGGKFTHVYIIAKIDGREVPIDTTLTNPQFDYEVKYQFKKDKMTRITYIRGVRQPKKVKKTSVFVKAAFGALAILGLAQIFNYDE